MTAEIMAEMAFGPYPITEVRNYWLKMNDGVAIATKVWLPWKREDNGCAFADEKVGMKWFTQLYEGKGEHWKEEKFPVILEFLPYRKDDSTAGRDLYRHSWFASYGFVCVRADIRGSGSSGGVYFDTFEHQEMEDCKEIINWLAKQYWSNGKVAMYGRSWGAVNGLLVAYRRPEALKALISVYPADDRFHQSIYYNGGCVINGFSLWCSQIMMWNARAPDPRFFDTVEAWSEAWKYRLENGVYCWAEMKLKKQKDSTYWKALSICEDYERIECPALIIGAFECGYTESAFRTAAKLNPQSRSLIGPWNHESPEVSDPGPRIDFLTTCLHWFQYHLKDQRSAENDVEKWPRLTAFVREGSEPKEFYDQVQGFWINVPDWDTLYHNPPNENLITFHFTENYGLSREQQDWNAKVPLTPHPLQGLNAGEWCAFTGGDIARDQTTANQHSLCFESQPLEEDLLIFGFPKAHLTFFLANAGIQGVVVRLCHQLPNGTSTRIGYAVINFRKQQANSEISVEVGLKPTGYIVPKGHRIALAISPTYFPFIITLPVVNGISFVPEKSKLVIFTLDSKQLIRRTAFDPPKPFLELKSENIGQNEPTVVYKLAEENPEGWTKFESSYNYGPIFYPKLEMEMSETMKAHFDTKNDCSETKTVYWRTFDARYCDKELKTRIKAKMELGSNSENFEVKAELEVFLNDEKFFENQWQGVVAREYA